MIRIAKLALLGIMAVMALPLQAQNYVNAQPKGDHHVNFDVTATGTKNSSELKWGADIAWMWEYNLARSKAFMQDALQVVRTSFQPTADVGYNYDDNLSSDQETALDTRIDWLNKHTDKNKVKLVLNCDHVYDEDAKITLCHANYKPATSKGVYNMFAGSYTNANTYPENTSSNIVKRWVHLIELNIEYYKNAGYDVIGVAPLNEPDYKEHGYLSGDETTDQKLFQYVAQLLKQRNQNISICGPNTLGFENAEAWTSAIGIENLDEVNTHELGWNFNDDHDGTTNMFADYWVGFYEKYKGSKKITNDEMHNTFEGMVGLEHGLTTGIWWGQADYVRGEFCKATHGEKLAYAEDRTKYTAATVYRTPAKYGSKLQAFGGTSERNAQTTAYRFVSTERDVFFDGQGPMREYTMILPGGTGPTKGQTNAEGVVNITYGEDIQPYINGTYALFNKSTNRVLELKNRNTATGTHITTGTYNIAKDYCQWNVYPVATTVGGGFSYHTISNCAAALYVDCWNSAMESGTEIGVYTANGAPQFWYFDYAGDGWFHIRSGISALCLATKSDGTICQVTKDASDATQLWRLLPVVDDNFTQRTVGVPANVRATAQNASIKITWTNAGNKTSYSVFKSETSKPEEYELIARDIKGGEFVDNKVVSGTTYYYVVKAVDAALNTSERSSEVSAAVTGAKGAVLEYGFERVLTDASANKNNAAALSAPEYAEGRSAGFDAMKFDGNNFLRLSTAVGSHSAITVAAWVYWTGSSTSERIFEFAKDANNYFCLTPNSAKICVNGSATSASMTSLTKNTWTHVAVTLDGSNMKIYVGGTQKTAKACTQKPSAFLPFLNAIGAGQASDAANFNGMIDNFHVYNYAMSASEIQTLSIVAEDTSNKPEIKEEEVVDDTEFPLDYTNKVKDPSFDIEFDKTPWTFEVTSGNPNKQIHSGPGDADMGYTFAEYWQSSAYTGRIYQDISGLPDGVYELRAWAVRNGQNALKKETVYLFANSDQTEINATPARTYVVRTIVTDGNLRIGIKQDEFSWDWMAFNDVELYYYGSLTKESVPIYEEYKELKASIQGLLDDDRYSWVIGQERTDLAELKGITVPEKTATGFQDAVDRLNTIINDFKNALPQYQFYKQELDNADKLGLDVTAEREYYTPTTTATILKDNFPALYKNVNEEIDRMYDVNYTKEKLGSLLDWETTMEQLAGQHWNGTTDGTTGTKYLDKGTWAGLTFDYARKTITLPAGRYAVRGVGRAEGNPVDVRINAMGQSMRFPVKGDTGYGVTTSGEKTFDKNKDYANGDAGRGWEYRNILFDLDRERDIELEFNVMCTGGWWSLADVELWRMNDVVDLTITSAGYSTLILPFGASIPDGLHAFKCSNHTTDKLVLEVAESIEANVPYIIKGTAGTYTFKGLGNITQDAYTDGFLTGVYVDTKAPMGSYVLQKLDGKVAFYKVTAGQPTVKANRAYVTLPEASEAKMLSFAFGNDDETTDIEDVEQQTDMDSVVDVYSVTGVKLYSGKTLREAMRSMRRGTIYIVNGKKFVMQ